MKHLDFCKEILEVQEPWKVVDISIDNRNNRLDIHLGFDTSLKNNLFGITSKNFLFGRSKAITCPSCQTTLPKYSDFKTICFRHLPVAGFATYLHVPPPEAVQSKKPDCICQHSWSAPGTQCTAAMYDHVVTVLRAVSALDIASKLTGLPESELQQIAKSLTLISANNAVSSKEFTADASGIPGVEHPGWQLLIKGELLMETSPVALRMLLQRLRRNCTLSPGIESEREGAASLQKFFLRNSKILHREIEQYFTLQPSTQRSAEITPLPDHDDDIPAKDTILWRQLVFGDLQLTTHLVGLQMLIEKTRNSIARNPDEANIQLLISNLYQFFIKHKKRLQIEISQLQNGISSHDTTVAVHGDTPDASRYPDEDHPIWSQLIYGEKKLQNDILSLNLLLERSRRAISQSTTDSGRRDEVRNVRNFIISNKKISSEDIAELIRYEDAI